MKSTFNLFLAICITLGVVGCSDNNEKLNSLRMQIDDASKKIEIQVQELASIHENYKLKMKESEGDLKEWVARIPNQIDKNLSKHLNEINQAYENSRKSTEQLRLFSISYG